MEPQGKIALVTGGASGLGLATCTRLVEAGAKVIMLDLEASNGHDVATALGGGTVFAPGDVTSEEDVRRAVELADAAGGLSMVVNCAGVVMGKRLVGRKGPIPLQDFERVIRINLLGTVNVMRLAAAAMLQNGADGEERGVIINTASVAAFDGQIGQTAYAASKAAIAGLTLPAARELAESRIRVMSIAPGTFETPMMAGMSAELQTSLGAQVPHPNRMGKPAEYAALALHIINNPMLNGETIRLDGAIRMAPR